MSPPTDYLRVSYSSLNTYASCPRKFEFSKLYPRPSHREEYFAASVGTALHAGYQDYLINSDVESATWAFMRKYPFDLELMEDNLNRSFESCLATLDEMLASVQMADYEIAQIRKPDGSVGAAIEVPFELRFDNFRLPDGRGIAFIGYIDAILRNRITSIYRTMDIKTTRMKLNDATPKFQFDSQQVPYGIIVDHVAEGEVDEFEVLYLDCWIDLLEPTAELYPFKKRKQDVQEWITNKMIQFESITRFMESDYFPRTDGGCLFYNRPCQYMEPCQSRDREGLEHCSY